MNAFVENEALSRGRRKRVMRSHFDPLTLREMSRIFAPVTDASNLVAYIDGGSLGNPGPSGIGVVIDGSADGTIRIRKWIGHQDNNVAEYIALLAALQFALSRETFRPHNATRNDYLRNQLALPFCLSHCFSRSSRARINCRPAISTSRESSARLATRNKASEMRLTASRM